MKSPQLFFLNHEPHVAKAVHHAMNACGYDIYEAKETESALRILREHGPKFDLALINLQPETHALTLLAAIKDCCEDVPVIVLIDADHNHEAEALAYGAAETIPKPINAARLAKIAHRFCGSQHS